MQRSVFTPFLKRSKRLVQAEPHPAVARRFQGYVDVGTITQSDKARTQVLIYICFYIVQVSVEVRADNPPDFRQCVTNGILAQYSEKCHSAIVTLVQSVVQVACHHFKNQIGHSKITSDTVFAAVLSGFVVAASVLPGIVWSADSTPLVAKSS